MGMGKTLQVIRSLALMILGYHGTIERNFRHCSDGMSRRRSQSAVCVRLTLCLRVLRSVVAGRG